MSLREEEISFISPNEDDHDDDDDNEHFLSLNTSFTIPSPYVNDISINEQCHLLQQHYLVVDVLEKIQAMFYRLVPHHYIHCFIMQEFYIIIENDAFAEIAFSLEENNLFQGFLSSYNINEVTQIFNNNYIVALHVNVNVQ